MRVVWTDRAKLRLQDIRRHIAQDAPRAADKLLLRMIDRSQQLAELPWSGRAVPEFRRDDIRELLVQPYRIIYFLQLDRQRIDILTGRHYRQLLHSDLSNL